MRYLLTVKNLSQRDSPEQPLVGEARFLGAAREECRARRTIDIRSDIHDQAIDLHAT